MVHCAVFGCGNNNSKNLKRNKTVNTTNTARINYFCFPADELFRQQWIARCCRKNKFNSRYARICSEHFRNEDFLMCYNSEILGYTPAYRRLKSGAIPQLKLPKKDNNLRKMDGLDALNALEIKVEQEELIIKDEPQEVVKECWSFEYVKLVTDPLATNTEIKLEPSICGAANLDSIPEQGVTSKLQTYLNSKLRYKVKDIAGKIHMVTDKKPYKRQHCDKSFTQNFTLKRHNSIHEDSKAFNCKQCGRSFKQKKYLKQHMLTHTRPFKCQRCDKDFTRNWATAS